MTSKNEKPEAKKRPRKPAVNLVVSDDKIPKVELKAGMRFEVVSVAVVDEKLRRIPGIGARLCGGTSTCLALVDLDVYGNPVP